MYGPRYWTSDGWGRLPQGRFSSPRLGRVVVHHVDDPAGRVQGCGGWQGDAEVTGMEPQAGAGWRRRLSRSAVVLQRKLRLGDAFSASRNDPPLRHRGGRIFLASWHSSLVESRRPTALLCLLLVPDAQNTVSLESETTLLPLKIQQEKQISYIGVLCTWCNKITTLFIIMLRL